MRDGVVDRGLPPRVADVHLGAAVVRDCVLVGGRHRGLRWCLEELLDEPFGRAVVALAPVPLAQRASLVDQVVAGPIALIPLVPCGVVVVERHKLAAIALLSAPYLPAVVHRHQ